MSTLQQQQHDIQSLFGHPKYFWPPRLSDDELGQLADWATYCLAHPPVARRLADYLLCITRVEAERRQAENEGHLVIEASLSSLPCHEWPVTQVVAGLCKVQAIAWSCESDELKWLMRKLMQILTAEACYRLDPRDAAGILKETK